MKPIFFPVLATTTCQLARGLRRFSAEFLYHAPASSKEMTGDQTG
jgi:hypothetical protein